MEFIIIIIIIISTTTTTTTKIYIAHFLVVSMK